MRTVVIDPDGTASSGLFVVVPGGTGTIYQAQCAGVACEQRQIEGFLVPVGDAVAAESLQDFFARLFRGSPPPYGGNDWNGDALDELADLVRQISYWFRSSNGSNVRTTLALDIDRVPELTEAWIPVHTADCDAILICKNSD